ncbi:hypothetical protein [Psychrobacillus sp.]|uniref:hypothetical protein n=1 Tax=Psychrobacillus sp. TaxID=1871623 RepID=UPI0028BDABC0|nr:hypothetical protein [Psychrobacillus sp.]
MPYDDRGKNLLEAAQPLPTSIIKFTVHCIAQCEAWIEPETASLRSFVFKGPGIFLSGFT